MPLTDTAMRSAKPCEKPYKLSDEKGLFLLINSNGSKWWRLKFRVGGKEKMLSFGTYPDVGLKDARAKRDEGLNSNCVWNFEAVALPKYLPEADPEGFKGSFPRRKLYETYRGARAKQLAGPQA